MEIDKERTKLTELLSFLANEIKIKKKPKSCQNQYTSTKSNVNAGGIDCRKSKNQNIINKIRNRQIYGEFSVHRGVKNEAPFTKIPDYLKFCLRTEILPTDVTDNHVYMGLTACGQFLLSYTEKWIPIDPEPQNDFRSEKLEYRLYFWGFRPHHPCYVAHSVTLFDEQGVDHYLSVTMVQWKCAPWLLVVNGYSDCERSCFRNVVCERRSYITWAAVPSLGCTLCKKISTSASKQAHRELSLCMRHKILIHTKYDCGSFEPVFTPYVNMRCAGFIVINTGAQMHILDVQLLTLQSIALGKTDCANDKRRKSSDICDDNLPVAGSSREPLDDYNCQHNNSSNLESSLNSSSEERYISLMSDDSAVEESDSEISAETEKSRVRMADQAYEFVEEVENCEKIALFRKRRLADKKYEFREDTLADMPFYFGLKWNKYMKLGTITNKVLYESTNSNYINSTLERSKNSVNKNVNRPLLIDSDIKQTKPFLNMKESIPHEKSWKSNNVLPEYITNSPLITRRKSSLVLEDKDNFKCSLKFSRYFVEKIGKDINGEDFYDEHNEGAVSMDDQLPSGFHTALSLGVSGLQMISAEESNIRLRTEPVVAVTQQSFDMETFSYLVSCKLCEKQKKYFKSVQDWYSEILKVSPVSGVTCIMLVHLVAIPQASSRPIRLRKECRNCVQGDCIEHRRDYEAMCLFQWDLHTGDYTIIKHTNLTQISNDLGQDSPQMWRPNRCQAAELINRIEQDNIGWNMRVQNTLNTNLSLETITDWDHFIQLNRGHYIDNEVDSHDSNE